MVRQPKLGRDVKIHARRPVLAKELPSGGTFSTCTLFTHVGPEAVRLRHSTTTDSKNIEDLRCTTTVSSLWCPMGSGSGWSNDTLGYTYAPDFSEQDAAKIAKHACFCRMSFPNTKFR
jgi:hypothetical protein